MKLNVIGKNSNSSFCVSWGSPESKKRFLENFLPSVFVCFALLLT